MTRYIDADELDLEYYDLSIHGTMAVKSVLEVFKNLLDKQPTADVEEVKHGYWKDRYGGKYANHLYECSVCGKKALYEIYSDKLQQTKTRQVLSNGCPHCFAKMDGGEAE